MDFFIKKGSTHPDLVLELIKNSFTDSDTFFEGLANALITFSMRNEGTGVYAVLNKTADCVPDADNAGEYFLRYQFESRDVDRKGTFEAEFQIKYNDNEGNLIIPIREKLRVHVI